MRNKGTIIAYSLATRSGVIKTQQGVTLYFTLKSWLSGNVEPEAGLSVEFLQGPHSATEVRACSPDE